MVIRPRKILYGPEDISCNEYDTFLGNPGFFPYTRGPYQFGYDEESGRLFVMRLFAGWGDPWQTNERLLFLKNAGATGYSIAFDNPVLNGCDSDHPLSAGEVGRTGVSINSRQDMEILFDKINLGESSVSMTINASTIAIFPMYLAVAKKQGIPFEKLRGTLQNDPLKEEIAQNERVVPIKAAVKLATDINEYCIKQMPKWYPISISGYHIREAGSTAVQELAFTLADGICYVQQLLDRGLDVDLFVPRLSFFFNFHNDFFEEVAKIRAARRLWAKIMKEKFKAKNKESCKLKTHIQTAGCTLQDVQNLEDNIIRTTLQTFGAVLSGTQSLHTNAMDEALGLPTEKTAKIALRIQQIIACESQIRRPVDPLGGSYYVEALTNELEEEAREIIEKIDGLGGMISAVEHGWPQKEVFSAAYAYEKAKETGDIKIVGINTYVEGKNYQCFRCRSGLRMFKKSFKDETGEYWWICINKKCRTTQNAYEIHKADPTVESRQNERLNKLRQTRDNKATQLALGIVKKKAENNENPIEAVLAAVEKDATVGEVCEAFQQVYGKYEQRIIM